MLRHRIACLRQRRRSLSLAPTRQRSSWILYNATPDERALRCALGHQGLVLPHPAAPLDNRHRAKSLAVSDADNLRKLLTDNDHRTTNVEHAVVLRETPQTSPRGRPKQTHERAWCTLLVCATLMAWGLLTSTWPTWPCAKYICRGRLRLDHPSPVPSTLFPSPVPSTLFPSLCLSSLSAPTKYYRYSGSFNIFLACCATVSSAIE